MSSNEILFMPAQVKGINIRDSVIDMEEGHAFDIENFIYSKGCLAERKGYEYVATIAPLSDGEFITGLHYYKNIGENSNLIITSNQNFFKFNGTQIIDLSAPYLDTNPYKKWNVTNIANSLIFVNGYNKAIRMTNNDVEQLYVTELETQESINTIQINSMCFHKGLLFFSRKDTLNFWYSSTKDGNTDKYQVTEFIGGEYFKKGGSITAMKSWTRTTPEGTFTQLLVFTSRGEIAMFDGQSPEVIEGQYAWKLAGVYAINETIGYYQDNFIQVEEIGGSLICLTAHGFINVSDVIYGIDARNSFNNKVNQYFNNDVETVIKANINLFNLKFSFSSKYFIANIPTSEDNVFQFMYDVNNNYWTKMTGVQAVAFEDFRSELYFMDKAGTLFKMFSGDSDNGNKIKYLVTSTPIVLPNIENQITEISPLFCAKWDDVKDKDEILMKVIVSSNLNDVSDGVSDIISYKFQKQNIIGKKYPLYAIHGNYFMINFSYESKYRNITYIGMQYFS